MDQKKAIEALIKIADNQQKILNKMAQQMGLNNAPALAPQNLDANKAQKQAARMLFNALPDAVKQNIVNIEERGQDMVVGFKEGQKTQGNYDVVLKTLQDLTGKGVIQSAYNLKVV